MAIEAAKADFFGRRKLKNFFLAPKSQFRTAIVIFTIGFMVISTIFGSLLLHLHTMILSLAELAGDPVQAASATEHTGPILMTTYIFLLLSFLCSALFLAIKITHRYLGPMVPIHRHVKQLLEGNYEGSIQIRRTDEFQEIAEDLNRLTAQLREKAAAAKTN